MNFPSIDIQGSILSTDLLAKIRSEQATFQQGKDFNPESVGFTFKDFTALYGDKFKSVEGGAQYLMKVRELMNKPFTDLTEEEMTLLDSIGISTWDLIQANSGGHKCITNISGLNYLGRSNRPPKGQYKYNPELHLTKNSDGILIPTNDCPQGLLDDIMDYFRERNEDE